MPVTFLVGLRVMTGLERIVPEEFTESESQAARLQKKKPKKMNWLGLLT
jgi:hypothetical protein